MNLCSVETAVNIKISTTKSGFEVFFLFALVMAMIGISPQLFAQSDKKLSIDNSWIRQAPPTAKVFAAYFQLKNSTKKQNTLIKISSDRFDKIEIHRSTQHNGMVHMEQQENVVIPAQQKILFEPGGLHLMLFNPKQSLKTGENIKLKFWFQDSTPISIDTVVLKRKNKTNNDSHHHH